MMGASKGWLYGLLSWALSVNLFRASDKNNIAGSALMFDFLKPKSKEEAVAPAEKKNWFSRLTSGLQKTRQKFTNGLVNLLRGKKTLDAETRENAEKILLEADVGFDTTQRILNNISEQLSRNDTQDPEAVMNLLKAELTALLQPCEKPLEISGKPFVILVVGTNGSGKTTSIAKIANYYKNQQHQIMLAAGDTFRAAAIEQLQVWGERNNVPVIAQQNGADSASVIFDAMQAATARNYDILLADTAGRLHTQQNLMKELEKIKRVIKKQNEAAPQELLLVLDAGIGQNALQQAKQFNEAMGLTGLVLTKLDGTAKGGMIFTIAEQLKLPIRFIGVGEGIDDLKPFKAQEFVNALFGE